MSQVVQAFVRAFKRIGVPVYGRRVDGGLEVACQKSAAPERLCFEAFADVSDDLVRDGHFDPTKEILIWAGVLDDVPAGFVLLSSRDD